MQETWAQSLGWEDPLAKEGKGYPLQYSALENSMDCRIPWGRKESDTTERLSLHFIIIHTHVYTLTLFSFPEGICNRIYSNACV